MVKTNRIKKAIINWHETKNVIWEDYLIISKSEMVKRLAGVTQVITFPSAEATRTRLSHTLDVVWLVQTISEELGLSVKVAMAIALTHDIGHLPYGHDGERRVKEYLQDPEFNHGKNAVRIAKLFGINLHPYVAYGVSHHSDGDVWINQQIDIVEENGWKLSSMLVAVCDDIACFSDLRDIIEETKNIAEMKIMRKKAINLMKRNLRMLGAKEDISDIEAAHREILKGYASDIANNSIAKNGIYMSQALLKAFKEMKAFVYKEFHQCKFVIKARKECIEWLDVVIVEAERIILSSDYNSCLGNTIEKFLSKAQYDNDNPSIKEKVVDFITTCTDVEIKKYYLDLQ
jgi:hypothetical protein